MTDLRWNPGSPAAIALYLLVACAAPPNARSADASSGDPQPPAQSAGSGTPSSDAATLASPTAVTSPVFSNDSCEKDDDCVPVATCHPDKCMLRPHAGSTPSDMICTMECRGGTADCGYNHCGCALGPSGKKVCALLPGDGKR